METNTTTTEGFAGGTHVNAGTLTTTVANEVSPGLLRNEVDSRVARIRPMATPVDQISRMIGARKSKSMIVDYYSVDSKECATRVKGTPSATGNLHENRKILSVKTLNNTMFAPSDTLLVPGVAGADGTGWLMMYVTEVADTALTCVLVNEPSEGVALSSLTNKDIVRMGRAAGELDVQTTQFEAMPHKSTNYCQIFKAQIELSQLLRQAAKEVGWTFSDQEEVAVSDMRMSMEKSFVFGCKSRMSVPGRTDEVMFTAGIWGQAGKEAHYTSGALTGATLVKFMRTAFTGDSAGSPRKILFDGSGLIEQISTLMPDRVLFAEQKTSRWGVDFTELVIKFGTLMLVRAEVFDQCGHENDGLVIDPDFMTKYVHQPFRHEQIDMKRSGQRNTEATVFTEASCLVLRNCNAHLRIIADTATTTA